MPTGAPSDSAQKPLTPEVTWAQRSSKEDPSKNFIWITILASDVADKDTKIDLQPTYVSFSGYSTSKKATYTVKLEFYADVDPKESKVHHSARDVEMKLQKKDLNEEYWPRLLKDTKKMHFLRTDFDKWADEDEQEGVLDDDYMSQMGGMPNAGGPEGFGGLDFSKLGGGAGGEGGMPDLQSMMSQMGSGQDDDEEEDEDEDEEMPSLEEDDSSAPGSSKKIEEVE